MMYNKYTERMFAERVFFEFILIIYEYISECINIFKYKDSTGVVVGFYSPDCAHGIGVGGLHLPYDNSIKKNTRYNINKFKKW